MGASQSKNVVNAVANASNYISNQISVSDSQINNIINTILLDKCYIGGNLNINTIAKVIAKSDQIAKIIKQQNVVNDISQNILQEAISSIGSLGVGYASASNSASIFANATSTLIDATSISANKYSTSSNTFICKNSHIGGNVNIGFTSDVTFLSDQNLDQTSVQGVVNNISQSISQSAKATVAGLAGFLIALAILVLAVGYTFTKISSPVLSIVKVLIIVALLLLIPGLILTAYLLSWPPVFDTPKDCVLNSIVGCNQDCVDLAQNTKRIDNAPLRYIYDINDFSEKPGLLQLVISRVGKKVSNNFITLGSNGGFTGAVYLSFASISDPNLWSYDTTYNNVGLQQIPNPLEMLISNNQYCKVPDVFNKNLSPGIISTCEQTVSTSDISKGIAVISQKFLDYIAETPENALHARFILCKYLGIPLNVYVNDKEEVFFLENNQPSNDKEKCYKFSEFQINEDYTKAIPTGGKITGMFGKCNTKEYKLHKFMRNIGMWIILVLYIIIVVFVIYINFFKKKTVQNPSKFF